MSGKRPLVSAKGAYAALGSAGFTKAYVQRSLPSWWDNALLETSAGALDFAFILKERLGVDVQFGRSGELEVTAGPQCARFKHRASTQESELHVAATVGVALARMALFCTKASSERLPSQAKKLSEAVMAKSGKASVDFEGLLDYCWSIGIPVLFLQDLPKTSKRITGMALRVDGRAAIVLGLKSRQPARQLFVLAHELAHLCLGHVSDTNALVDEGLAAVTESLGGATAAATDKEEHDADAFALTMLRNGKSPSLTEKGLELSAAELALAAVTIGKSRGIDAGHLLLSYASAHDDWLNANLAMRYLPETDIALSSLEDRFTANCDLECLTDGNRKFLLAAQGFQ